MKLLACGCIIVASAFAGCMKVDDSARSPGSGGKSRQEPVSVTLERVSVQPVQRTVDVVGTLWGDEETTISAKVPGRIQAVYKDVGDRVRVGEPLLQIEKTDYDLVVTQKTLAIRESLSKLGLTEIPESTFNPEQVPTVKRAYLQWQNAKAKLSRGKELHEQVPPLMSDQDYADLETAAAVAQSNYEVERLSAQASLAEARARVAELDIARQRLMDTTVTVSQSLHSGAATRPSNPVSALSESYGISARMVSVGEYVKEGTPMFRLVDDDPVKLRAIVHERYAADVEVGQKVRVAVKAYPEDFWGQIARINPQIDALNRTFQCEIVIPNPQRKLKPGGFAQAWIEVRSDPRVVFAPKQAVFSFAGVSKVFTVKDGKAVEHIVEIGQTKADQIEIVKGLTGTESVIVQGLNQVAAGTPVILADASASPHGVKSSDSIGTP